MKPETHTDIKTDHPMINCLPVRFRSYAFLARLDRPIGIWLLVLPGWWAIALASGGLAGMTLQSWILMTFFGLGAVIMRAAGCVINDLWDRDLDSQVMRTAGRPLASGALTPKQALVFLFLLLFLGLLILLQMNRVTILLGLVSLPFIILYPLMKRWTWWPQAFLGLTFNFGALMGWSAVAGNIGWPAIFLYLSGIFWTLGYDTIYAHQDKEDDALAGIKSTALKFGSHSKIWVAGFYGVASVFLCTALLSNVGDVAEVFVFCIFPAVHFGWQLLSWDTSDSESALKIFKSNRICGIIVLITFLITTV